MKEKELLTIIVPCYNEEESLPYFNNAICEIADFMREKYELECEMVFIDDGSKDKTCNLLQEFSKQDNRFHYISFSRNFGKEAAIYAGLRRAKGDYVVVMDADMQDPPSLLPKMYELLWEKNCDSVATRRVDRKGEPPIRSLFAKCFYKLINKMSDADIVDGARDFRLMRRNMVDAVLSMSEYNRFSKGIFGWVGFYTEWLPYENVERISGNSKWSFWKLFAYALKGITAFSTIPLAISSVVGLVSCVAAMIMLIVIVSKTIIFGDPVAGWPSLACIIIFFGGMQLFCIGILGRYLANTYMETKKRPIYIIKSTDEMKR